ncbi:MAG: hypothetical protein AB1341_09525 [Bacillota bacterium]
MIDPIGSFDTINENFQLYVKTAFRTRFPSIEAERENLLKQDKVLTREPLIEPLPRYESSGKTIDALTNGDLPGLTQQQIDLFKQLCKCGLFGNYELLLTVNRNTAFSANKNTALDHL